MIEVWKYQIPAQTGKFLISMPASAEVISVQVQDGVPYIWALVHPTFPRKPYPFVLVWTGEPIEDLVGRPIGTFQIHGLVYHLFEAA